MTEIGYLDVGDSSAGGNVLELALKLEFAESVYFLADVHMIGIGVVALIRYVLDITVFFAVDLGKAVAEVLRFHVSVASRRRFMTLSANSVPFGSVWLTPVISFVTS